MVERWVQNPYYQAFCGEVEFQWALPYDSSGMTVFRKRIGPQGVEKIVAASSALQGDEAIEDEMCIDATVQKKNVTYPTDAKQYRKFHTHLLKLARGEGLKLSRTYEKEVKQLKQHARFVK